MRMDTFDTEIIHKDGHYEAYVNGMFLCSADTPTEAAIEIEEFLKLEEK